MPRKRTKFTEKPDFTTRTVFSTSEAAAYVNVAPSTFTHHIYNQGRIKPLRINPRLIVFSREQLDDYKAHDQRTAVEFIAILYTFDSAAAYLNLDPKEMRELVAAGEIVPVDKVTIGGQFVYTGEELERVAAAKGWEL